ncbi:MAG: 4'-phosphopantetheinyl transferase superfamily protein [Ruminococcus sp.]
MHTGGIRCRNGYRSGCAGDGRCPDYREIAENFYTAEEAEDVKNEGPDLFFQYWAAKEAYVKALGDWIRKRNGFLLCQKRENCRKR